MFALRRPEVLWQVEVAVVTANDRVTGILPFNPVRLNEHFTAAIFTLYIQTKVNLNLANVRVYGMVWAESSDPTVGQFPASADLEALCVFGGPGTAGRGQSRAASMISIEAPAATGTRFPANPLPNVLCLEYTTNGGGAGQLVRFTVTMTAIGAGVAWRE